MTANLVYMTAGSREEATQIGKVLVDEHLAACVNIIDGMTSIYRWEGQLQQDSETILIAKTTAAKVPHLVERVGALHSYDCPCVLALPVDGGNRDFLDWIGEEVR